MRAKIFGTRWHTDTQKALTMLEDSKQPFDFIDVGDTSSAMMDAMVALSGKTTFPQLHAKGVTYVGLESVQRYLDS